MNQPSTEQTIRDNEQLAELEAMYEQTERALVLIGDRMREIKNRLQKKPPVGGFICRCVMYTVGEDKLSSGGPRVLIMDGIEYLIPSEPGYTKLAGGKYEK